MSGRVSASAWCPPAPFRGNGALTMAISASIDALVER